MSYYRNGFDFEIALFGKDSSKRVASQKPWRYTNFSEEVLLAIKNRISDCPDTRIAKSLYSAVFRDLSSFGVDPSGMIFVTTLDTVIDVNHYTDAFFYLPSLPSRLVTIDAFNINEDLLQRLKDFWIDSSKEKVYSFANFQTDIFSYKDGMKIATKNGRTISQNVDYRVLSKFWRPENHFVITPYNVSNYRRRREFAFMIARYFYKEALKQGITK